MDQYLSVGTTDGQFSAYCVMPNKTPAPVVVVLQEIFGVNADIKETCEWIASLGYIALSPDLFWRHEAGLSLSSLSEAEWKVGLEIYAKYDRDLGVRDIARTLEIGKQLPDATGKAGVMGFCLGGLMTFLTTARVGADVSVVYYGGETDKYVAESPAIKTPLIMHLGEEDEFISKSAQSKIKDSLINNPFVRVYSYPGQCHAFARNHGAHYNAAAATIANDRTREFLRKHLT
jgi:carboxymethylenebutenolidase